MVKQKLKRYGIEGIAKALIAIGVLLNLFAWFLGANYFALNGNEIKLLIVPFIFTCVIAIALLVIYYRYTLFEKYPYLLNLPSLFYHIGEKNGAKNQSIAFSMIFTVHAVVVAVLGLMSVILTFAVGSSVKSGVASPFLYVYLAVVAILIVAIFMQYRRIYNRFKK